MRSKVKSILDNLSKKYELLKRQASVNALGVDTTKALIAVVEDSLKFLRHCDQITLHSAVVGKNYFSFAINISISYILIN
jgi:hypothetical protein